MGTLFLFFGVVMLFVAGMHFAMWQIRHVRESAFWALGLILFGSYNIIAAVGNLCSM